MPATRREQHHTTYSTTQASYKKLAPLPHAPTFQPITATLYNFGTFSLYMLTSLASHIAPLSPHCQSPHGGSKPCFIASDRTNKVNRGEKI